MIDPDPAIEKKITAHVVAAMIGYILGLLTLVFFPR